MSKQALKVILSVIIIGIVLAGLQGMLNWMAGTGPIGNEENNTSVIGNVASVSKNTTVIATPRSERNTLSKPAFVIDPASDNGSAFPALDIDIQKGLAAHLPLFCLSGNPGTSYLRTTSASLYQNGKWKRDSSTQSLTPYSGEKLTFSVENYYRKSLTNYSIRPVSRFAPARMPLPAAQYVNRLSAGFPLFYESASNLFISDSGFPLAYSLEAVKYSFDRDTLADAGVPSEKLYLEIPPEITRRTLNLADNITQKFESPYLKARAIEDFLKTYYSYEINCRTLPLDKDPVEWFLFDEKKGNSGLFNSAFVIMARAAGIPARMVGGYFIDAQNEFQIIYADQAHTWAEIKLDKLGWITFDASGTTRSARIGTSLQLTGVDATVNKNIPFTVSGQVTAENSQVNGPLVELFLEVSDKLQNGILIGQAIVSQNNFEIEPIIPDSTSHGNYFLIARSSQTPLFSESICSLPLKVMTETEIRLNTASNVKNGQALLISGQLVEKNKQAVTGQNVNIMLNDKPLHQVTTDSKGHFEYRTTFNQSGQNVLKFQYAGSEFYRSSEQSMALKVQNPTTLSVQSSPQITSGQVMRIEGYLVNSLDKQPMAGQKVELMIDSISTGIIAITNSDGYYWIEHRLKNTGMTRIDVKYSGQEYFWDATAGAVIEVTPSRNKTMIGLLLMLSGVTLACGYVGYRFYGKKRNTFNFRPLLSLKNKKSTDTPVKSESLPVPEAPPQDTLTPEFCFVIDFPSIVPPLPSIWGINEEFEVACQLKDASEHPVVDRQIEISIGSPITTLTTDNVGRCSVTLAFSDKGEFEIEATVISNEQNHPFIHTTKVVRIVDYREAIIQDYKSLLEWFKLKKVSILSHNSPHQIEKLIINSGLEIPADALATVIACFEEALYSSHPITRQEFVKMHLAQQEIMEYDNQPKNISAVTL